MPDEIFNWFKANKKAVMVGSALVVLDIIFFTSIFSGFAGSEKLNLHFLNVGQGDSEFIVLPHGAKMLIDGGPANGLVLNNLARLLSPGDRYIDLVVMTHPEIDHFGGLIDVVKQYTIGAFLWSGRENNTPAFRELLKELRVRNVRMVALGAGDVIRNEESSVKILSPNAFFLNGKNLNNSSLVMDILSANTTALFVGDIGAQVEEYLTRNFDIHADILKVPHHGSRFSSNNSFLREISPKLAIIEVGKNSYGHPTKETLARLSAIGARILRTDLNGVVVVTSEGDRNAIRLSVEK